jgi:hypothetical protein
MTKSIADEARKLLPAVRIPPPEALTKHVTSALKGFL